MNLIKHLFSHRQTSAPSGGLPKVVWTGQSGQDYEYDVCPLNEAFRALPGNYVYAHQNEDGTWTPIYIAQTRDLHQRLEGSIRLEDAVANGATHLHAHYTAEGQAARCNEERDLLSKWHPACNEVTEN